MWGLHKLTDGEGENENKIGRQGKRKMRATEAERKILSHSEAAVAIGDCGSVDCFSFLPFLSQACSSCQSVFLSSVSIHPRLSIQGHGLMSFNTAGQPGSLSLRK